MDKRKRILVAPLNWGLGHASRCIALIEQLLENNAEVIIAANGAALKLLQLRFPELMSITFKGYSVNYSVRIPLTISIAMQTPNIVRSIKEEHRLLDKLIDQHRIDGIISDNRYGLYSQEIPSVFICHQIYIKAPLFEGMLQRISKNYIAKYHKCWIPDYEGNENLSGDLAHKGQMKSNMQFIGPLSRFSAPKKPVGGIKRKVMVILSGPEPNRSALEVRLLKQLIKIDEEALIVQGKPEVGQVERKVNGKVRLISHLPSTVMQEEIESSELIICRSGYSSIMDMAVLGKKALLIPTEGQTEQEYLAKYHREKNNYYAVKENQLNLSEQIEKALGFPGISANSLSEKLKDEIGLFLESC